MTNWTIGVTKGRAKSQAKERVVLDIEKMLKDAKKTVEESSLEVKQSEKKKKDIISVKIMFGWYL